jgi:GT2 family glycosyltransferase
MDSRCCGEKGVTVNTNATEIVVVMLTWNQLDKTVRCLSSFRSVKSPPFHIVLWDNGSQDGTTDVVQMEFPEVLVHHHPSNLGAAAGRNAAVALATKTFNPSYLLFIDNDTVVTPGFLDFLLQPFKQDAKIAQTAPKIRSLRDQQRLQVAGGIVVKFGLGRQSLVGYGEIDRGQYDKPKRCVASGCTLVRADVFREVGGFDPVFDPYGYEDVDLSLRIYQKGYYALYVPQSLIFHEGSRTFVGKEYSQDYARLKAKNYVLFMRRHASPIEKLRFSCFGGPLMFLRATIREARKGNLGAIKGLVSGIFDLRKASRPSQR